MSFDLNAVWAELKKEDGDVFGVLFGQFEAFFASVMKYLRDLLGIAE